MPLQFTVAGPQGTTGPAGATGATGATGLTGPTGPSGGSFLHGELASSASPGATTLTLTASPSPIAIRQGHVAISPFTTSCEIRTVTAISGSQITVAALRLAHTAADKVIFFSADTISASWFGAVADGSTGGGGTDNEPAIQQGLIEAQREGLWLTGEAELYAINQPLVMRPGQSFRHATLIAGTSYAPTGAAGVNGAMLMQQQGAVTTVTAVNTTSGEITLLHDLTATPPPVDDTGIVFKGTVPTGITAGRVYYVKSFTAPSTLTISATRGGATIVPSATTTGARVYTEVNSLHKVHLDSIYVYGRSLDLNGVALGLQQLSIVSSLRVDFCTRGLVLYGQQAKFIDLGLNGCGTGLQLEGASFMYFTSFNCESSTRGVHVPSTPAVFDSTGAGSCYWKGVHFENQGVGAGACDFDIEENFGPCSIENAATSLNLTTQKFFWAHAVNPATCSFEDVRFSGAASINVVAIQDDNRSQTLTAWDDFDQQIGQYRLGGFGVNKDGKPFTFSGLPTDAEIVAGQVFWFFDSTPGATKVKFKGKDSGGTVRTGEVSLT